MRPKVYEDLCVPSSRGYFWECLIARKHDLLYMQQTGDECSLDLPAEDGDAYRSAVTISEANHGLNELEPS